MITHTRAVILRAIDYQESSKILTVLSEEHGKIALIAKGAKKPKNKLSGMIDVGNILDVVYYYKASRGVQILSEASIGYSSLKFRSDFNRAAVLYATLELVSQLIHDNEVNRPVFDFASNFIIWLGDAEETSPAVFPYVQLRMAEINGIGVRSNFKKGENPVYLNISSGIVSGEAEDELSFKLKPVQSDFIYQALNSNSKKIFTIGLENGPLRQLINHLDVYFKYHVEGYKERRSDSIFEKMLQDG